LPKNPITAASRFPGRPGRSLQGRRGRSRTDDRCHEPILLTECGYATSEQCDTGRGSLTAAGAHYTTCLPQDAASCFTFHSKLLDRISFDCSATIAACERQRNYALTEARADVGDVHDCTTWRAGPDDDDPPTRPSKRYGGNVLYCSDMAANGQVIHRYTCQFEEADCMRMADGIERSGEAAFRAQGKDVDVTMGRCKKSTEPAYCALFDDGYTCTALKVHCDAMAAEALRSGKVATVGRCVEWRPGKHL
jgi:hypothetical protein